jgi:FkbM family methyltransferase
VQGSSETDEVDGAKLRHVVDRRFAGDRIRDQEDDVETRVRYGEGTAREPKGLRIGTRSGEDDDTSPRESLRRHELGLRAVAVGVPVGLCARNCIRSRSDDDRPARAPFVARTNHDQRSPVNDPGIERVTELLRRRVTALKQRVAAADARARESQARAAAFSEEQLADLRQRLDTVSSAVQTIARLANAVPDALRERCDALDEKLAALTAQARAAESPAAADARMQGGVDAIVRQVDAVSANLETVAGGMRERHDAIAQSITLVSAQLETVAGGMRERYDAIAAQLAGITASSESRPVYRPTLRGGRDDVLATLVDGLLVAVPAEELRLALYHTFYGFQEPGVRKIFNGLVQPGHTVVDVGASIGMYSLCAARIVGEAGSVLAFEPTPRTYRVLVENLKFNGFWDNGLVRAHQLALGETTGTASLYCHPGDFGFNTLYRRDDGGEEIAVRVAAFDEMFPDVHVDVVKIDAEGAEPAILAGMARTIERNAKIAIIIEFAPSHLERAGVNATGFARQLLHRYDVLAIDVLDGSTRAVTARELSRSFSVNLLLTRRPEHGARE